MNMCVVRGGLHKETETCLCAQPSTKGQKGTSKSDDRGL